MFKNIFETEREINRLIEKDNNCSAHFDYKKIAGNYQVDLITYNPVHKTHFLLHKLIADDKISAINEMYDYVYNLKESMKQNNKMYLNYTIEWFNRNEEKKYISNFYGKDMDEIMTKFYYCKSRDSIIIYNISLNSEA